MSEIIEVHENNQTIFNYKGFKVHFPDNIQLNNPTYSISYNFKQKDDNILHFTLQYEKNYLVLNYQEVTITVNPSSVIVTTPLFQNETKVDSTQNYTYKDFTFTMHGGFFVAQQGKTIVLYYNFNSTDITYYDICDFSVLGMLGYDGEDNILTIYKDELTQKTDCAIHFNYNNDTVIVKQGTK